MFALYVGHQIMNTIATEDLEVRSADEEEEVVKKKTITIVDVEATVRALIVQVDADAGTMDIKMRTVTQNQVVITEVAAAHVHDLEVEHRIRLPLVHGTLMLNVRQKMAVVKEALCILHQHR